MSPSLPTGAPDALVFAAVELWGVSAHPRLARWYLRRALPYGRLPQLALPASANDKFRWRKVFDHDPRFVQLSDKLACKEWVRGLGLDLPMAAVLWVGTDAREIPASVLSGDVVLKSNHGCGHNHFIREGRCDRELLSRLGRQWLRDDHGRDNHEWGYFDVPRRLFVEELIAGEGPLQELKIYTFGENVERVAHIADRFEGIKAALWVPDASGRLVRGAGQAAVASTVLEAPLPPSLDRALVLARTIGSHFDHMRVDLMTDGQSLWLGELTVYNQAGAIAGDGHDPDAPCSRAWDLRRSAFLRDPPRHGWRARYAQALLRHLPPSQLR